MGCKTQFVGGKKRSVSSCGCSEYGSTNGEEGTNFKNTLGTQSGGLGNEFDMQGKGEGGVQKVWKTGMFWREETKLSGLGPGRELVGGQRAR